MVNILNVNQDLTVMALSQEIQDESELAKSYVANSDLDDEYKKILLRLINISTLTTNGISPEEKIQKMTEAIHLLAITQVSFITKVDEKIQKSIQNANNSQCQTCKAMKHTNDVEEEEKWKEKLSEYKQKMGITDDNDSKNTQKTDETSNQTNISILDTIKQICLKPYVWIFGSVLVFSPYGVEIIKTLIQFFGK